MKKNCWDYFSCGKEIGGKNIEKFGVCPVSIEKKLDKIHNGKNAGRSCWVVAETFCGEKLQGNFVNKVKRCLKCEFYKKVFVEESKNFVYPIELMKILKEK